VAYATLLNGLLPRRFKFSLAESEVTKLAEALKRAKNFIDATEICVVDDFYWQDTRKRGGEEKGSLLNKRPIRDEKKVVHFYTSP